MDENITHKFCPRCEKEYPANPNYFSRCKSRSDGLFAYCKGCHTQLSKARYHDHTSKILKQQRDAKYKETIPKDGRTQYYTPKVIELIKTHHEYSNNWIAKLANCGYDYVVKMRYRLEARNEIPFTDKYLREDGTYRRRMVRKETIDRHASTQIVYFVQSGAEGPIKIGYSADLRTRLSALRTSNPEDVYVRLVVPGTTRDEWELHQKFAKHWLKGEWFRPHTDILEYIETRRSDFESTEAGKNLRLYVEQLEEMFSNRDKYHKAKAKEKSVENKKVTQRKREAKRLIANQRAIERKMSRIYNGIESGKGWDESKKKWMLIFNNIEFRRTPKQLGLPKGERTMESSFALWKEWVKDAIKNFDENGVFPEGYRFRRKINAQPLKTNNKTTS